MELSARALLLQEQRLLLSPQMRQSLAILQMGADSLYEYLIEQAMENPVIVIDELEQAQDRRSPTRRASAAAVIDPAALALAAPESAFDRLKQDFSFASPAPAVTKAGCILIDRLDENGYLKRRAIRELIDSGMPRRTLREAFHILRSLEPAGVGARDLRDCLLLQLDRLGLAGEDAWIIVAHHLALMGRNQLPALSRAAGLSMARTLKACELIRSLRPRPLAAETAPAAGAVIPDFSVHRAGNRLEIELNQISEADLRIDEAYLAKADDPQLSAYLQVQFANARWLRRCLSQRNRTLRSCAETLVAAQSAFFFEGPRALIPYTRRQAAQTLGLHESTVSRALQNKFFSCELGTFPVELLFPRTVSSELDAALHGDALLAIKRVVELEERSHPLSDAAIAALIRRYGVSISRRTVAKYREQLGIPASSLRRQYPAGG